MTQESRVFDDVRTFTGDVPQLLRGRAKTDLLLVCLDVFREEPLELTMRLLPTGSDSLNVLSLEGDHALAGADPVLMFLFGGAPASDGPHPVDVIIDTHGIAPDAVAVIYAGSQEWTMGLEATKKLRERLPDGKVFILACDCAKQRKLDKLVSEGVAVDGLIFTPDCGGAVSIDEIASAFVAAARACTSV